MSNFHPLVVVGRSSETQLEVDEKENSITRRLTVNSSFMFPPRHKNPIFWLNKEQSREVVMSELNFPTKVCLST